MPADDDPYVILGVSRQATDAAIVAAYRDLARRYHPDIAGEDATAEMMRINAAFDAIRTAKRRLEFGDGSGWSAGPAAPPRPTRPASSTRARPSHTAARPPSPGVAPRERERQRWRPERDGTGGAGPPPGRPSGSVLGFGRHVGWSIGEIARVDPGYLEWLSQRREGAPYLAEIDAALQRVGFRGRTP